MEPAPLVLFDLDGTLLDGAGLPAAMRATCAGLARRLPGVSADALVAANTAVWQRVWPEYEDEYQLGGRTGDDLGEEAWRETLREVGAVDPGLVTEAVREWEAQQRAAFRLFDDAGPALDALEAAGVRIGMITNGSGSVQRLKLDAVGLTARLDPLVISAEIGLRKPDERVFEIALHRAGAAATTTWFVGDNLWHDIAPAAAAGLRTAWIDRHGHDLDPGWPQPGVVLRSLRDLPSRVVPAGQDPR